jgi:hypothetical protein
MNRAKKAKSSDKIPKPKIGQKIYIRSSWHISAGHLDIAGGLATISKVETIAGDWFVELKEVPNHGVNYSLLYPDQAELKKEYKGQKAHPDPDIDTPWIEEGDYVGQNQEFGKEKKKFSDGIYHGPPIW